MTHALKTGLAAALATAVYMAFALPYGYWAVVSAVVVMQVNLGSAIKASWARLVGTAIGAFLGAVAATAATRLAPQWLGRPDAAGILFTAAMAGSTVALTAAVCIVLRLEDALRLAGVTCSIVLLAFARAPWTSAAHRTLDVAIGIGVALVVSMFVLPSRARQRLIERLGDVVRHAGALSGHLAGSYLVRDYAEAEVRRLRDAIKASFRECRALVHDMEIEPGSGGPEVLAALDLFRGVERILQQVMALDEAARASDRLPGEARHEPRDDVLHREAAGEIERLVEAIGRGATDLATALSARVPPQPLPEVDAAADALDARLLDLRQAGASRDLPLDEVMRFYQFVQALKSLGRDLATTAARAATELAGEGVSLS